MAAEARTRLFHIFAAFMLLAAAYHFLGLFFPINEAPAWRHGLFVLIDATVAYALLKCPPYLVYLFPIFLVQQYYTHGSRLAQAWAETGRVDWISVVVLVVLPVVMVLLIVDARARGRAAAP